MELDATRDDIRFMREVNERGSLAPLVGGRYLVMWGTLMAIAYVFQYLILSRIVAWPGWSLLAMWAGIFTIAGILTVIFGHQMRYKPGTAALGNRLDNAVWYGCGMAIFSFATGTTLATAFAAAPIWLFDIIIIIAFAGYGSAFLVMSSVTQIKWMRIPAVGAYTATGMLPFFIGDPVIYLISAGFIIFLAVIPGLISIKAEPAALKPESAIEQGMM